jgi:hypothetical protein
VNGKSCSGRITRRNNLFSIFSERDEQEEEETNTSLRDEVSSGASPIKAFAAMVRLESRILNSKQTPIKEYKPSDS